jgi:flagellar biosynthesis protein FlhG
MFNQISTQASKLINLTKKQHKSSKTKVIAITSGKGGVGKSTFTANLSYIFSTLNKKVLVIDADIGLANMQILFDLKPQYTINDYLEHNISLDKILLQTKYKNISLVAGKSGHNYLLENSQNQFSRVISEIKDTEKFDYIFIDTGAGLSSHVQEFLDVSDEIVAVTTTDPSALTDVYALIKMLSLSKKRLFMVFNHTKTYKIGETITQSLINLASKNKLNKNFMVKYLGNIIVDLNIATTGRLRKLYTKELAYSDSTISIQTICKNLIKEIS